MTKLQKSYGTLSDAQIANFVSLGDDRAFDELALKVICRLLLREDLFR